MQFEKDGLTQCELIRQSMRQLSRITMKLRKMESSKKDLSDYLIPQKFDFIIKATRSLCDSHQNNVKRPEFEVPSLALKIGYAIKKCALIKRGICLRGGNISENETIVCFLDLMSLEWNIRISSNALATVDNGKFSMIQLLPLTNDLIKLSHHINSEMKVLQESLKTSPKTETWTLLAVICLSKIMLFNKGRSDEPSRMTISDYNSRLTCHEKPKIHLTDFEKKNG